MSKRTLTDAHCLLELIEKAPASVIKVFSGLPECQALARGFDWSQDAVALPAALIEHVRHLRKDQRDPAEREALRVLRLASPRGAQILTTVAGQFNDNDLIAAFMAQDGGEIGRSVWMRTHSDESARLFDVAESILNTGDLSGNKRLHDAFDVPCDEAPPFIWSDSVKKELETHLTTAMRLAEPCEVSHVPLADENRNGYTKTIHYLVVRFSVDQVTAVQAINRNRRSFGYFPARDATLIYAPHRKMVEVYAHTLSTRAPLANVLSTSTASRCRCRTDRWIVSATTYPALRDRSRMRSRVWRARRSSACICSRPKPCSATQPTPCHFTSIVARTCTT